MNELFFYAYIAIISILINISCGIFYTTKILEITIGGNYDKNNSN